MSTKQLTPANKDKEYQIPLNETGFYHVRFTEAWPTANPDIFDESSRVQTFSVEGFKGFMKNKKHFNFKSEVILHDPTYKPKQTVPAPTTMEPEQTVTVPAPPVQDKPTPKRVHRKPTKTKTK